MNTLEEHGRNFVAESEGDDSRILRRVMQNFLNLSIFCPNSAQSCNIWIGPNKKELNQSKKVGGTKHSLSPGGKKVGGTCNPSNYAHDISYDFCLEIDL